MIKTRDVAQWVGPRLLVGGLLCLLGAVRADGLATIIQLEDFDNRSTAIWGNGEIRRDIQFHPNRDNPSWVIWTRTTSPGHNGYRFGAQWDEPGTRHFRIGFTREVPFGSALMRAPADVRFSVLRPDAPYPGDMADDSQWLTLESVQEDGDLHWLLPADVLHTRAVRFSFETTIDAPSRQVDIHGLYIFARRVANLAPASVPIVSTRQHLARRLIDGRHRSWWDPWSNLGSDDSGDSGGVAVSPENPQWAILFWDGAVALDGLMTAWTGFREADVQVFDGPEGVHPREAEALHWRSLGRHRFDTLYPSSLGVNLIEFAEPVRTRAVRLMIVEPVSLVGAHSHIRGKTYGGARIWLGEWMALHALGDRAVGDWPVAAREAPRPPIPVAFELDRPGYVTLVIDDRQGRRVRNLVAERYFDAGEHTVYWDGKDESIVRPGRVRLGSGDIREGVHGINDVDGVLVEPATYVVHGLVRDELRMVYQTTVNHAGHPPWTTADGTGRWLADHSAPSDAQFLPGKDERPPMMILSARVAESGDGVIWTDLEGRKLRSVRWLGGHWTGAYYLARDEGGHVDPEVQAYTGSNWSVGQGGQRQMELRIGALRDHDTQVVVNYRMDTGEHGMNLMRGLAARDGMVYASLAGMDKLVLIDAREGEVVGMFDLPEPAGLTFDARGRLLAISGKRIVRYDLAGFRPGTDASLPEPEIVVDGGLQQPVNLACDAQGRFYVSDWGADHTVKVFQPDGEFVRAIGTPGGPRVGPYDETRMHHPTGMSLDNRNRLWVVEADLTPKRISVWTLDGEFVRAFYGPSQYGGGGTVDPKDRRRLYYTRQEANTAMEFQVDWKTGDWKLAHIIYRPGADELQPPNFRDRNRTTGPQWPIHVGDRQYMTNAFNSSPTNGSGAVTLWLMRDNVAYPVAIAGDARRWSLLGEERFLSRWPEGVDPSSDSRAKGRVLFVWSDLNHDGQVQPDEVTMHKLDTQGVGTMYVRDDLAFMTSFTYRLEPRGFTAEGVPVYHAADAARVIDPAPSINFTSGGGEAIDAGEWIVLTGGPMRGYRNGERMWTYPCQWPGLHAGHHGPATFKPGQLVATTRILGQPFRPPGTEVDVWAINGDKGQVFLLTVDGLYVATLGRDANSPQWRMPYRERGMRIDHVGLIGEHFWPTLIQPETGPAVLVAGKQHSSIVTVEGLETIHRLTPRPLEVTVAHLAEAGAYQLQVARELLAREGRDTLRIARRSAAGDIEANPANWADADWTRVDPDSEAALAIVGDRLVGALRSRRYHNLLVNTGESLPLLFKTGGALDLMIGVDPESDPGRSTPAPGDQRLLMSKVDGKTVAMLYEANVPGTPQDRAHPFSSPWRTVTIDRITEVGEHVEIAQREVRLNGVRHAFYEWAVPLRVLGWKPVPGQRLRGDVGLIRGRDGVAVQRVYWQNKATNVVEDVPSEATLVPALWGIFEVQK